MACVKGILSINEETMADTHRTRIMATSSCLSLSTLCIMKEIYQCDRLKYYWIITL